MKGPWRFYPGPEGRSGEKLVDLSSTGRVNPWARNKNFSLLLAESYRRLSDRLPTLLNHSDSVAGCASWLKFSYCTCGDRSERRLVDARFCRKRLCPVCQWRRSLLISGQVSEVAHAAHKETQCVFLMLTLTVKNCLADDLDALLDVLVKSLRKIMSYRAVKNVVVGWFRALEVTISKQSGYHPHFHVLLAVSPSYFTGKYYIPQAVWSEYWRKALQVDYMPLLHISRVKGASVEGAAAEVAKYSLKPGDYLHAGDPRFTDSNVWTLHDSLKGRRLYGFGGRLKEIHNDLFKGADLEGDEADLVGSDLEVCTCSVCGSGLGVQIFNWFNPEGSYFSK